MYEAPCKDMLLNIILINVIFKVSQRIRPKNKNKKNLSVLKLKAVYIMYMKQNNFHWDYWILCLSVSLNQYEMGLFSEGMYLGRLKS